MNDVLMWISAITFVVFISVAILGLLLDGAYQVATGRPGFNPLPRLLRRRVPATELDYVRLGAYGMLQATALLLIAIPIGFNLVSSTARLTGLVATPAPRPPAPLALLVFIAFAGSIFLGIVLMIAAFVVSQKVKYVPIVAQAAQNQPTR